MSPLAEGALLCGSHLALAAHGHPEHWFARNELRARLRERRLRMLVAREAKRGPSGW